MKYNNNNNISKLKINDINNIISEEDVEALLRLENEPCMICWDNDDEDELLLCEGCECFFHYQCMNYIRMPRQYEDFYCGICSD